jgi:hypothetical protein
MCNRSEDERELTRERLAWAAKNGFVPIRDEEGRMYFWAASELDKMIREGRQREGAAYQ